MAELSGRRVMVGTPSHNGTVHVHFAHSIAETVRKSIPLGCEIRPVYIPNDALIQRARNELVGIAYHGKVDDLVFIDADQQWEPEWLFRLLRHPVDCVGAPVRKKTDDKELYNVLHVNGVHIPTDPATGLMVVDSVGTGFLRLTRKALSALWELSEAYVDDGKDLRWVFDAGPMNGKLVGEDTSISHKLKLAGIDVFIDPTINPGHVGSKMWRGDFLPWLKRLQMS